MQALGTFLIFLSCVNAYNILVYSPAYGSSHSTFMGRLADTLTDAGHNVTLLVPVADVTRRNITGVRTTKDVVFVDQDEINKRNLITNNWSDFWMQVYEPETHGDLIVTFRKNMVEACANLMRNKEVFTEMKSRNFDVVLSEPLTTCGVGYAHKLGITKSIQTSSCTYFDFMNLHTGEPDEHSYVPALFSETSDKMNLWDRYENWKSIYYMRKSIYEFFDNEEKVFTENHQLSIPGWRELFAEASMHFTNSNPNIDFPRPVIQKTVLIGGVSVNMDHIRSQKLGEEWSKVLNLREKTILISFGSMVPSEGMPSSYRETLMRVIQSFPNVTFIWKYESDDTKWAEHVPNVYFSKWVPQTALLNDQRITAFLTHGGLGSLNELAHAGKPALMVPIAWDQTRNSKMFSKHGAAITIRKVDLGNFDLLKKSFTSILFDESYTKNAQKIAEILENQPLKPRELVVKYTEFVARFGPFPNMDPYVRHLNFIQRTGLDVLAIFYFPYILAFICIGVALIFVLSRLKISIVKRKIE